MQQTLLSLVDSTWHAKHFFIVYIQSRDEKAVKYRFHKELSDNVSIVFFVWPDIKALYKIEST